MTTELSLFDQKPSSAEPLTMSSREIADLVGSRHDNVKRTIETCVRSGAFGLPPTEEDVTYEQDTNIPHKSKVYRLDKRSSLIVVAQLCPEFTAKIVDRWQELESTVEALALPTTYLDALKALVTSVESQQRAEYQAAELATENAKLLPRAKVADTIADAEGLHSVAAAAKILGTGQKKLFARLRKSEILNAHNVPYQQFIERGYFVSRESTYNVNGVNHIHPQTFVTGKGMAWMARNMIRDAQNSLVQ